MAPLWFSQVSYPASPSYHQWFLGRPSTQQHHHSSLQGCHLLSLLPSLSFLSNSGRLHSSMYIPVVPSHTSPPPAVCGGLQILDLGDHLESVSINRLKPLTGHMVFAAATQGYRTRSHQTAPYSHQMAPTVTQRPHCNFLSKIIL